jgi:cellulose synthase/poly-beta-1,6-N-acetylglucosamine synthase-like glycosyltransferase
MLEDPTSLAQVDVPAMVRSLSVLISTHDRADLLERTIRYLNEAARPRGWNVEILVVANACSDRTHAFLSEYVSQGGPSASSLRESPLGLKWVAEPAIGKSNAQNRAMHLLTSEWVAFVDDDHRVDPSYLVGVCSAVTSYPDADIFCGRILPDWDGTEPAWVHDRGAYRIYPLPVPRYDLGDEPLQSAEEVGIPGGGNLVVRRALFERVGSFATDLGPRGHNLAGGEDQEWVRRAIAAGARLQYVPGIVQHHYVDHQRLRLSYLMRKAYERSASVVRFTSEPTATGSVPAYLFRKAARHTLLAATALTAARRRFHLVRVAASLGEIKGHLQARADRASRSGQP